MTPAFIASFTGTAVEFFETVAIAYAIVRAGYPREALSAVVIGHVLVFILAAFLFPLHDVVPVFWLRLVAALLLTGMGLHWTQKSLRRLWAHKRPRWAEDPLGKLQVTPNDGVAAAGGFSLFVFFVMGKSAVVEAAEILLVIFPVAAATAAWGQVILGVAAGIVVVSVLAFLLHGQLKKVPEVKLKLVVGVVLLALGLSWLYEVYEEYGQG
ncbi:hypothetical protein [Uliginosibacterium sp. H1]|uniref:hypothetical protein n=1 Tax=Uliginosibacterium sp. H1 TaxID=3114757 RepID=UPI002E18D224|nr:hypothetical protein [Uliginosibacterium sp. H1]